jgi:hypothetical protein
MNQYQKTLSEKTIEKRLTDEVKNMGGLCVKMGYWGVTGMPDRLILMPGGRLYFREIKTETGKLSKMQELVLKRLQRLGFDTDVLFGKDDVEQFINQLENLKA